MLLAEETPRHRPYRWAAAHFEIGLKPMPPESWLDTGSDHAAFMAAKRARLAGRPPLYYRSLPVSLPAQAELRDAVVDHLLRDHPHAFRRDGSVVVDLIDGSRYGLAGPEPLAVVHDMAEEDFILFQTIGGRDIITAASNAYTSSGRIVSCVGRDMRYAHDPVPGLNDQLGPRIDRVLGHVQKGAPVVRFNWFITPIAGRLFPEGWHGGNEAAAAAAATALAAGHSRAGDRLWLRVERQTFLRLPQTGALAFGLHTYSDPLSALAGDRESLVAIRDLITGYSADRLHYAGLAATRGPILRWIADRLA
jgi:hypothetical protein